MAKVFLANIEEPVADSLKFVLATQKHRIENRPPDASINEFLDADVVFVGADDQRSMPLLRTLRKVRPGLPLVAVTAIPNTSAWLTALDAGATDYCSAPFEPRAVEWLMESVLRPPEGRTRHATNAAGRGAS